MGRERGDLSTCQTLSLAWLPLGMIQFLPQRASPNCALFLLNNMATEQLQKSRGGGNFETSFNFGLLLVSLNVFRSRKMSPNFSPLSFPPLPLSPSFLLKGHPKSNISLQRCFRSSLLSSFHTLLFFFFRLLFRRRKRDRFLELYLLLHFAVSRETRFS